MSLGLSQDIAVRDTSVMNGQLKNDSKKCQNFEEKIKNAKNILAITYPWTIERLLNANGINKNQYQINALEGLIYKSSGMSYLGSTDVKHLFTTETRDNDFAMFDGNEEFDSAVGKISKQYSPSFFCPIENKLDSIDFPGLSKSIRRDIIWTQQEIKLSRKR